MNREQLAAIGGIAVAGLLAVSVAFGASACSGSASTDNDMSTGNDTVEISSSQSDDTDYVEKYDMKTDFSYQGVSLCINEKWKPLESDDGVEEIDPGEDDDAPFSYFGILTGTNGETSDGESAVKNVYAKQGKKRSSADDVATRDSWSASSGQDGMDVDYLYSEERTYETTGNNYSLSGISSADDKTGFVIYLVRADGTSDDDWDGFIEALKSNLSYDPSSTDYNSFTGKTIGGDSGSSSGSETEQATSYGPGTYKVGTDIPSGEYELTATDDSGIGYWEVTNTSLATAYIVGNENFSGGTYVTVTNGQYLTLSDCTAVPA